MTGGSGFFGLHVLGDLKKIGVPPENIFTPSPKELNLRKWDNCVKAAGERIRSIFMMKNCIRRIILVVRGIKMFKDWHLWLLARFRLLRKVGIGTFRMRDGSEFLIDFSRNEVGTFQEVWLMDMYEKHYRIQPGDKVVDIGASIGAFSVLAAKRGARVYAYEPTPRSFSLLAQNIKGYNVTASNLAVAGKTGRVRLFFAGRDEGNSLIHAQSRSESLEVSATTLDEILKKVGHCDFLKIDCEGGEMAIFENASPETWLRIDRIAMEYHRNLPAILAILRGKGYDVTTGGKGGDYGHVYAERKR